MQNLAGSTLQSRNSVRLCPSAVPDVNKALIRPGWAAAGCSECSQAELGTKFLKKIRKKWSEACLKQLLQQMSQFSCFAESRFHGGQISRAGAAAGSLCRIRSSRDAGFPQLPPWASSRSCAWARGQLSTPQRAVSVGTFPISMQGCSGSCHSSRCWEGITAWSVPTGDETEGPPLLCFWIAWHTLTTVPWLGVQGCDSEGFWFAGE